MNGLEKRLARGGALMVAMKLGVKVLGFVSTMVVARILTPADYGIVAVAMGVIGILEILGEFSFDLALIRNRNATSAHYNTAWTLNLIRGVVFAIGVFLCADPIAAWVGSAETADLLRLLALIPLLDGLTNIGTVDFRKQFKFERELALNVLSKLIEVGAAIAAAFALRSFWALGIGIVVGRMANVALGYVMSTYRPRPDLSRWREIAGFSGWMFGYNITFALSWRLDVIVVGRLLPTSAVGFFTNAISVAALPSTELVMPIARALYPGYSLVAEDIDKLRRIYLNSLAVIAGLAIPITFGLAALAHPAVMILLGAQWRESAVLLSVIAPSFGIYMLLAGSDSVLVASGRTRSLFLRGVYRLAIRPAAFYIMVSQHGLMGVAWAIWLAVSLDMVLMMLLVRGTLRFRIIDWLNVVYRPMVASVAMWAALPFAIDATTTSVPQAVQQLAIGVPLGVIVYSVIVLALWRMHGQPEGFERMLISFVQEKWKLQRKQRSE
jgi:O-antigen/teichoic acid export membrane protein